MSQGDPNVRRIIRSARLLEELGHPNDTLGALDELAQCKQLLRDIDANMRRAWKDGSLSAEAWPTELAQRLSKALQPNAALTGARDQGPGAR